MKKQIIFLLIAIAVSVGLYAFSSGEKTKTAQKTFAGSKWFDFVGSDYLEMADPDYYILDANNFPDCTPMGGDIYCEIFAQETYIGSGVPDLSTITNQRMKLNF